MNRPPPRNLAYSNMMAFGLLFIAGLGAYWPALRGGFLWDDSFLVGENPFFKSPVFIGEVFRHYLYLDSMSGYYRPVQNISYMLDYWLWASNPFGYHLSNIIYHVLTAFTMFALVKKLLPGLVTAVDWRSDAQRMPAEKLAENNHLLALAVALLWVVHPIHNAAVAYVAGRADSLADILAVCGWLLCIRADTARALWAKCALRFSAMLIGVLALCAKEIALIWMALFLFHLFVFNRDKKLASKFAAVIGVAVVMGSCVLLRHFATGGGAPAMGADPRTFAMRVILAFRALGDYTWLVFFPDFLHMDRIVFTTNAYANMEMWQAGIRFEYLSLIGLAMIGLFIAMGVSKLPGQRLRLFALSWFMLGFLPISNLFPLNAQVAEHWIYMPSMGLLLFFAGCALALPARWRFPAAVTAMIAAIPFFCITMARIYAAPEQLDNYRPAFIALVALAALWIFTIDLSFINIPEKWEWPAAWRAPMCVLGMVVLLPFMVRTAFRSYDWGDTKRFFTQTIQSGSGSTRVNLNLALDFQAKGDYATAEKMMRAILKRFPDYMPARINLGMNLRQQHKDKEAEEFLNYDQKKSEQISKEYAHTWSAARSMAEARYDEQKYDEALAIVNDAIPRYPGNWDLVQYKAKILDRMGRIKEAITVVKQYADANWWHYQSHATLGGLYREDSDLDNSIAAYHNASRLDIHNGVPWFAIAQMEITKSDLPAALAAEKKGLSRNPDELKQYIVLAYILNQMGRKEEAADALQQVEDLRKSVAPAAAPAAPL